MSDEQSKVEKKFDEALSLFTKVLGGEHVFKPMKLASEQLQKAVAELAAEEINATIQEFKKGAKALIQKKKDHDEHMSNLEKEFKKKKEESMKLFVEEADRLKRMIGKIEGIEQGYYDVLKSSEEGKSSLEEK